MGFLLAKKRGKNGEYVKMITDVDVFELPNDLDHPRPYDPNYALEQDEWFAIEGFGTTEFTVDIINQECNSADFSQITMNDYNRLAYFLSYQDNRYFYFQKISQGQTVRRAWFELSNEPTIQRNKPILVLKAFSDAIYDSQEDLLYFKKLSSITSIFDGISDLYKEATNQETEAFLSNSFINLIDDYDASKVKTANRKRIAMAMNTFNSFTSMERNEIYQYVKDYCTDLPFSDANQNFEIGSEESLKKLLFGIEQRYYTTPIGGERRLANSVITLNNNS